MDETRHLLDRVGTGDKEALEELFARYGERLRRMIRLRIHPKLRRRVDEDDVVQEVLLEASQRLARYLEDPRMPFFVWIRFLTAQRLAGLQRHHLGVQARDARREVPLAERLPGATSDELAASLSAHVTSPTEALARKDDIRRIAAALDALGDPDREILVLRHYEQLTNAEAAHELGLDISAASKRYARALTRLKKQLSAGPELL